LKKSVNQNKVRETENHKAGKPQKFLTQRGPMPQTEGKMTTNGESIYVKGKGKNICKKRGGV